jgi:hypothetical protein
MMSEEYKDSIEGDETQEPKKKKLSDEEQLKQAAKEFKEAWQDESWWEKTKSG